VTPLRLLILGGLLYVFFRLILGRKKTPTAAGAGTAPPPADVLVEDPVCRVHIPRRQAISITINGQPRHFCSETCKQTFMKGDRST